MDKNIITKYGMKKMVDLIANSSANIDISEINLPALLRCTIQLHLKDLNPDSKPDQEGYSDEAISTISESLQVIKSVLIQTVRIINEDEKSNKKLGKLSQEFTNGDAFWIASKTYFAAQQALKIKDNENCLSLSQLGIQVRQHCF